MIILEFWRLKPQQRLRSRPTPTEDQPAKAGFVIVAVNLFAESWVSQ